MKGKWDDFIDDMAKDVQPAKADPKEVNMNELGKMMEEQVKKAFESVSKKQEPSEPAEPKEPDEDPDVSDDNVDDMNDEREDN